MKLFLVIAEDYDYDEWIGFVIRAASAEDADRIAYEASHKQTGFLSPTITEITLDGEEGVILDSFNAG